MGGRCDSHAATSRIAFSSSGRQPWARTRVITAAGLAGGGSVRCPACGPGGAPSSGLRSSSRPYRPGGQRLRLALTLRWAGREAPCAVKEAQTDAHSSANRPGLLAAEIEAAVSEFNRLAALACDHHIAVLAELRSEAQVERPDRPILAVQVIAPL